MAALNELLTGRMVEEESGCKLSVLWLNTRHTAARLRRDQATLSESIPDSVTDQETKSVHGVLHLKKEQKSN